MQLPASDRVPAIVALPLLMVVFGPAALRAQDPPAGAMLHFHLAQEALRAGDPGLAAGLFEEAVALDPGATLPRIEWAAALLGSGNAAGAGEALAPLETWWREKGVVEDALAARYARLRAASASRLGQAEDALRWYESAVQRAPLDIALRSQLVGRYRARGDEESAALHLRAIAAALPANAEVRVELGHSLLSLERWDQAATAFAEAAAIDPGLERAWDGLGVARAAGGDLAGAEEALRAGLRVAPASAVLYEHLGDTLRAAGRDDEALVAYRRAAALAPGERRLAEKIDRVRSALP